MKIPLKLAAFWKETARPFLVIAVVLFSFRSAFADWNDVPTGSMKPTIVEGDRVIVNKLAYDLKIPFTTIHLAEWSEPKRGDVVVFYSPKDGTRLVKRVIGLPGDQIEMVNEQLLVNGRGVAFEIGSSSGDILLAEETIGEKQHRVMLHPDVDAMRSFGPVVVPEGTYFVMGDNRDDSFDSRYLGPIARRRIVGRATAVAFSFDREHYYAPRLKRFFTDLD